MFWTQFSTYRCPIQNIILPSLPILPTLPSPFSPFSPSPAPSPPFPLLPLFLLSSFPLSSFLSNGSTASQLTYHGICELNSRLKEGELGVFFRNNHFNTLLKRKVCAYFVRIYRGLMGGGGSGVWIPPFGPPPPIFEQNL